MKVVLSLKAALALLLVAGNAQAATVTYVDAVADSNVGTVNTVESTGALLSTWYEANGSSATVAGKWARRADPAFGNGGDILQGHTPTVPNDIPELTTTISGLNVGESYEIFTFFWDADGNQAWSIDAGLTSGNLTIFTGADNGAITSTASGLASDLDSDIALTASGNRELLYASIGVAVAGPGGSIDVFIDSTTSQGSNTRRAWYDGVGYSAVAVPEPSSAALLCLGGGFLVGIRRRKMLA